MFENLKLENIRIVFNSQVPVGIGQIANAFICLEDIFKQIYSKLSISPVAVIRSSQTSYKYSSFDINFMNNDVLLDNESFINLLEELVSSCLNTDLLRKFAECIFDDQSISLIALTYDTIIVIKIADSGKISIDKKPISKHKKDFKNIEDVLSSYKQDKDMMLIQSDLEGLNLSGINLQYADLSRCELSEANLTSSDLSNVILRGADLSNSKISGSALLSIDFEKADLSGADISGSDLTKSNLYAADLSSANLTNAMLVDVNISEADFSSANLTGACFSGNIVFDNKTDFSNKSNWWDAKIYSKNLLEYLQTNFPQKK